MLPTLKSLAREHRLLDEVLRSSSSDALALQAQGVEEDVSGFRQKAGNGEPWGVRRCQSLPERVAGATTLSRLQLEDEGLQQLPEEVLAGIAESFLEAPAWHLCKLGEASSRLGQVFMDDARWNALLEQRFLPRQPLQTRAQATKTGGPSCDSPSRREGVQQWRSQSQCHAALARDSQSMHWSCTSRQNQPAGRSLSPSARLSYARLHQLEARFRQGRFSSQGQLGRPRPGVAVMDLRLALSPWAPEKTTALAALQDGSLALYALKPVADSDRPEGLEKVEGDTTLLGAQSLGPQQASPIRELRVRLEQGPALCCLPLQGEGERRLVVAGFALGCLAAWEMSGQSQTPGPWAMAHAGRVASLAVLTQQASLLSAASDGLLKEWNLGSENFGRPLQSFRGHRGAVVSVATSPHDGNLFLSGGHDRTMQLWDVRRPGAAASSWQQRDWVTCVDFHPTQPGGVISADKAVHFWDLRAAASPVCSMHRHRKLVSQFRVDPLRLASCSLDGCVKVSSLEERSLRIASPRAQAQAQTQAQTQGLHPSDSGGSACTLRTSSDYVLCIDFDATRLLAGGLQGQVDIYDFSQTGHFFAGSPESSAPSSPPFSFSPCHAEIGEGGFGGEGFGMTGLEELEL